MAQCPWQRPDSGQRWVNAAPEVGKRYFAQVKNATPNTHTAKTDELSEKFQREGVGVSFQTTNHVADFLTY